MNRRFDEVGLLEDVSLDVNIARQIVLKLIKHPFDASVQFQRIGMRLLLNGDDDRRAADHAVFRSRPDAAVAATNWSAEANFGDVADQHGTRRAPGNGRLLNV